MKRWSKSGGKIIFLTYLLILTTGCSSLFFYPQRELIDNPALLNINYRNIYFKTPDGVNLNGWLLKTRVNKNGTVLFLHGNAQNISTHVNSVLWLLDYGYDVFLFDYRGYGKSEGHVSLKGSHLDAISALDALLSMTDSKKKRVVVYGQSLGGAIAVYTVANSPHKAAVDAIILDSAFSSYRTIAREKLAALILTWPFQYPLSFLISDYYSPVRWIKKVYPVPVLLLHGDKDRVVAVDHSRIIYNNALSPKEIWVLKGLDHIEGVRDEGVRLRLLNYLDKLPAK
ncbi:MAG: alpha/beta hydrolase [Nitrospirae bacterium]|nr:alpha/beta hydrolase [Nitrospirota bacterium]